MPAATARNIATIDPAKQRMIKDVIAEIMRFRLSGPSDDPDEHTAVTLGYRRLLVQLQRWATPILPQSTAESLNALTIDVDDLYTVYDATAEVVALLPDIEKALEAVATQKKAADTGGSIMQIPLAVCSVVGDVLGTIIYHHSSLDTLFYEAGGIGEVPPGNCVVKCQTWLRRMRRLA